MSEGKEKYLGLTKSVLDRVLKIQGIFTIFNHTLHEGYSTDIDCHDFWEYVYVSKGKLYVETRDKIQSLSEGELFLYMPQDQHRVFVLQNTATIHIVSFACDYEDLATVARQPIKVNQMTKGLILDTFEVANQVYEVYEQGKGLKKKQGSNKLYEQLLSNHIEDTLIRAMNDFTNDQHYLSVIKDGSKKDVQFVKDVIHYLEAHVYERITIQDLCRQFHVSKTTLSVKFKEATMTSVVDYFNHLKIIKSMELLQNKSMTVSEVAFKLNISTSQYFSKLFKQYTGVSPKDFLNQYQTHAKGLTGSLYH